MKRVHRPVTSCVLRNCGMRNYSSCLFNLNRIKLFDDSRLTYPVINNHPSRIISYTGTNQLRYKSDKKVNLSDIIVPVPVHPSEYPDDINIGEDLTGSKLKPEDIQSVLMKFYRRPAIKTLASENGMDPTLLQKAFASFKSHCLEAPVLEPELHIILDEIIRGFRNLDDLFPSFLKHSRMVFPHLECIHELRNISDLRLPHSWYPEARAIKRKIIFHSGPTNSGKTYNALKAFMEAPSGVYCGPLKLLAVEVNNKSNEAGTKCDLVTGEERKYAMSEDNPSQHVSCTVEMVPTTISTDVAIIDEIQMMRDPQRGWAWTRALLGIPAKELHLCGEAAAIDLVRQILSSCDEEVEVRKYDRLTSLSVQDEPLGTLAKVEPGDCIVCFSKADIFNVTLQLEKLGHEVAVIYGSLPPSTKLAQAKRFNDPNDSCKLLVATDAIGMGLNLSIRRVIFYSIKKPNTDVKGEKKMELISTSAALQIGGRAGRFKSNFTEGGLVTTMHSQDIDSLKVIMSQSVNPLDSAGIHPTADQIEMFAYYLPNATLSNLIDIFTSLCQINASHYFMCNIEDFKFLADMIQHVPLPLRSRYVFCCAPINRKAPYVCTMFLKFARLYSNNEPITAEWLRRSILWPFDPPTKIQQLFHMESVFDCLDLYLWLSYRFPDLFSDQEIVRLMQIELDQLIHEGVAQITKLLRATDAPHASRLKKVLNKVKSDESDELSITTELVNSGVISKRMMERLQSEWSKKLASEMDNGKKNINRDDDKTSATGSYISARPKTCNLKYNITDGNVGRIEKTKKSSVRSKELPQQGESSVDFKKLYESASKLWRS